VRRGKKGPSGSFAALCEAPRPQGGASRKGSFVHIVPLDPAYKAGLAGRVPANSLKTLANFEQRKDKRSPEHGAPVFLEKNIIKKRAGTSR